MFILVGQITLMEFVSPLRIFSFKNTSGCRSLKVFGGTLSPVCTSADFSSGKETSDHMDTRSTRREDQGRRQTGRSVTGDGLLFVPWTRELPCCHSRTPTEPQDGPISERKQTNQMVRLWLTRPFLQCGLGRTGNTVFKVNSKEKQRHHTLLLEVTHSWSSAGEGLGD